MPGYFKNFPLTTYANTQCVDILRRVRVLDRVRTTPFSYYPYTVKDGQRADSIAHRYYHDQFKSWLVYLSMDIIDPYYQYPLSEDQFNSFIDTKYGGIANAQNRIAYWELNWSDDDGRLAPSGFNSLPDPIKKYYNANYGIGSNILSYSRRKEDWLTTTNMIVTYTVTANTPFHSGELLHVMTGNTVVGNVEVAWANSSSVIVQNVQGDSPTSNAFLISLSSNVQANIVQRDYTSNCIAIDERVYWEPVTCWDHERSRNESRKHIRLIDSNYSNQTENELSNIINEKDRNIPLRRIT